MNIKFSKINLCLAILAFYMFLLSAGCMAASNLKILNSELTSREFTGDLNVRNSMSVVTGAAMNTAGNTINNCVVTVTFYDAQRNSLGVASAERESLGAGETWNFAVQLTGPDAWKARSYDVGTSNH